MSVPEPIASNTTPNPTEDPPFFKFPPFPGPPTGVTIMPFKYFKPRGIQLFSELKREGDDGLDDDDAELDALGIPTVELRIKHATDECKSSSRKKRKKKKAGTIEAAVPAKKLAWYEEWAEGEDLRVIKVRYDSSISPVDRLFQCAYDFRTGRPWPPVASGLNSLWDQFRLFTGLLVNPSSFRKAGSKKYAHADSPDFESDEEDGPSFNIGNGAISGDLRPAKRHQRGDGPDDDDEDNDDPHKLHEEVKEEKMSIFLSDPEKAVRIFFSSFMREHGLIWTERNLINLPRLISFFLAFVLRNRALPEPVYQRGLKRALEAIELAKHELPLTNTVGLSLPDAFNEGCREYFGRQGGINWTTVTATTIPTGQKDAVIAVTDISNDTKTDITLPTEVQMQLKDAIEDNIDIDMEGVIVTPSTAPPPADGGTGPSADVWGGGWGGGWSDEGTQNAWGDDQGADGENWVESKPSWNQPSQSLLPLLGPSTFPSTHTTGIVECSTRRVAAVHFPPNHPKYVSPPTAEESLGKPFTQAGGKGNWAPSACGVEAELDSRFAKVILEPWGREEGDISTPEIWITSRGPVIDPKNPSKVKESPDSDRKPHNPLTDSITLLVQPSLAETLTLVPGLGLGAMWIEIVRQKNGAGTDPFSGIAQVDDNTQGRFWYHEDVTGIFPSYYTPQAE